MSEEPKFKIGDHVCKPEGYKFDGFIRAVFRTGAGNIRYVVEHADSAGLLHIFNQNQLHLRDRD
jgi:hypothetical protein